MTKFQEGLHVQCQQCGENASQHRLTDVGNFYCLTLNEEGWDRYAAPNNYRAGIVDMSRIVYTCAVKYLRRSPLPQGLGVAINGALKSFPQIEVA